MDNAPNEIIHKIPSSDVEIGDFSPKKNCQKPKLYFCPKTSRACSSIFKDRSEHMNHKNGLLRIPSELNSFSFTRKLGQGAYGAVFLVFDKLEKEEKALKLMFIDDPTVTDGDISMLKKLRHQNIVGYYGSGIIGEECAFVLMELCNSDLDKMIKENKLDSYQKKVRIFKEICKGIKYLHSHEIVHRDLKPKNILIKEEEVRISDFGISKYLGGNTSLSFPKATPNYCPPEVLDSIENESIEKIRPSKKQDMFSIGIICHQIFANGSHPFNTKDNIALVSNIRKGNYKIDYDQIKENSLYDLIIKGCLQPTPHDRLDINKVLQMIKSHESNTSLPSSSINQSSLCICDPKKAKELNEQAKKLYSSKDFKGAILFYEQAALMGNGEAFWNLGLCYKNGEGVEKNITKAAELYEKAAALGNDAAMTNLGFCYQNGKGVEKNLMKAVELYEKAIALGNDSAMNKLGLCYKKGQGVEKNLKKAVELYEKAVALKNDGAIYNLGLCYKRGEGVEKNLKKAVELYEMAVALGNKDAMNNLGNCYYRGEGVERNLKKAVDLYEKAVTLGNDYAMNNLGNCYKDGVGVEHNLDKALVLFKNAAHLENSHAKKNLKRLEKS